MSGATVVVTGMGLVTPAGPTAGATWSAALEKRSGIGLLRPSPALDRPFLCAQVDAEVDPFEPDQRILRSKASKFFLREDFLGTHACLAAADDAMLSGKGQGLADGGLFCAAGKDEIRAEVISDGMRACMEDGLVSSRLLGLHGLRQFHPFSLLETMPNTSLFAMSAILGLSGQSLCLVGGAATGAMAVGEAVRAISHGECPYAVAGAQDSRIDPFTLLALEAEGLLAAPGEDPATAMRPFDRRRQGFALAEGAGFVVLETAQAARQRGAPIRAEVLGYGAGRDGAGGSPELTASIRNALADSDLDIGDVDAIFAWGDCTVHGDLIEAQALHGVFGSRAETMPVCCLKPVTGNMLAASGVAEIILAAHALRQGVLPPTMNHDEADPACGLRGLSTAPVQRKARTALCLSHGLQGQNAAILLRAPMS